MRAGDTWLTKPTWFFKWTLKCHLIVRSWWADCYRVEIVLGKVRGCRDKNLQRFTSGSGSGRGSVWAVAVVATTLYGSRLGALCVGVIWWDESKQSWWVFKIIKGWYGRVNWGRNESHILSCKTKSLDTIWKAFSLWGELPILPIQVITLHVITLQLTVAGLENVLRQPIDPHENWQVERSHSSGKWLKSRVKATWTDRLFAISSQMIHQMHLLVLATSNITKTKLTKSWSQKRLIFRIIWIPSQEVLNCFQGQVVDFAIDKMKQLKAVRLLSSHTNTALLVQSLFSK